MKKTIIYRGSLKSCNYTCPYCPFSKHKLLAGEEKKDFDNLEKFCKSIEERVFNHNIGAVFITPYGEAAIHEYYWNALARLSVVVEKTGIQTNLSFDAEHMIDIFDKAGGKRENLSIWATFHPAMTSVYEFSEKCRKISNYGINICAGAVGVPENADIIKHLRVLLPQNIYLWINKMDGLRRNYTASEIEMFTSVDPFFCDELEMHSVEPELCAGRCFIEADGKIKTCNICRPKKSDWYLSCNEDIYETACTNKRCSCFLAYGGRADIYTYGIYGRYPVFRVPEIPKAIFFDIDGTILPAESRAGISSLVKKKILALKKYCLVFFVTSMPEEEVRKRLGEDVNIFNGGSYASGAYTFTISNGIRKEKIISLSECNQDEIKKFAAYSSASVRLYIYRKNVYKVTIAKKHGFEWSNEEINNLVSILPSDKFRIFSENHCLQIVSSEADKALAVRIICSDFEIQPSDTLAFGNSQEDFIFENICKSMVLIDG